MAEIEFNREGGEGPNKPPRVIMSEDELAKLAAKLTPAQRRAVLADRTRGDSSYDLRVGLNTLASLKTKGIVLRIGGLGSMAFPHTAINWPLTNVGKGLRAYLERQP